MGFIFINHSIDSDSNDDSPPEEESSLRLDIEGDSKFLPKSATFSAGEVSFQSFFFISVCLAD